MNLQPPRDYFPLDSSDKLEDEILGLSIEEVRSELVDRGIELTLDADLIYYGVTAGKTPAVVEDELEREILSLNHDDVKQQLLHTGFVPCTDGELENIFKRVISRESDDFPVELIASSHDQVYQTKPLTSVDNDSQPKSKTVTVGQFISSGYSMGVAASFFLLLGVRLFFPEEKLNPLLFCDASVCLSVPIDNSNSQTGTSVAAAEHLNGFTDNFELEMENRDPKLRISGSMMNIQTLHNFKVIGLIDLIHQDNFGLNCSGNYCLNLDGTDGNENPTSMLTSDDITLDEGQYILKLSLGGNARIDAPNTVAISIDPFLPQQLVTVQRRDSMKVFEFPFTVHGSGNVNIVIELLGLSDGSGTLLDDISIEKI